jgi:mannosyltransferase
VRVIDKEITKYDLALVAIILIGVLLRAHNLSTSSVWIDEAWSVWISKMSLSQIVDATRADYHPPLYFFALHFWMMIFGTSESAIRLLSVLFGVLAIPMTYVVGRQLFDKEVGLVAALILALSPFNIQYSQETRMYSLMVLLTLLSMYFFLRFLQRSTLVSSAGYVLFTTLLIYTHYYGLFVVLAQNVYVVAVLLLSAKDMFRLRQWVILEALVVALFAPWIGVFFRRASTMPADFWVPFPTLNTLINTFVTYSATTWLLMLFLALSVLSLFSYRKTTGSFDWKAPLKAITTYSWNVRVVNVASALFLVVWLFALTVIPFVMSRVTTPIYYVRYSIPASIAFYVLIAGGIRNINWNYARLGAIAVIIIVFTPSLQAYYVSNAKGQAREATSFLDANAESGDVILAYKSNYYMIFDYYNNRTDLAVRRIDQWPPLQDNKDKIKEMIYSNVTGYIRVWFFASTLGTPIDERKAFVVDTLNESYTKTIYKSYNSYDVYLFERRT